MFCRGYRCFYQRLSRLAGPPWRTVLLFSAMYLMYFSRSVRSSQPAFSSFSKKNVMIFECFSTVLQGWRARLGGPFFSECIVFWFGGPALAGLSQVLFSGPPWRAFLEFCSLDECLLLFFRVGGPALAGLLLFLPEAFEVGGPALAGRPAFLCNLFDVVL